MTTKTRLSVSISEANARKLNRLSTEQGVARGEIVDEALTLLFLPPLERPEAMLTQQIRRIEDKIARLDVAAGFQADLLVEFIFAWLQQRPGQHPFRTSADDARAGAELEALMKRVVDRSNPHIWG
jgi:hypothetical protein